MIKIKQELGGKSLVEKGSLYQTSKDIKMNKFKIIPLEAQYASRIRETEIDDFGNKIVEQVATGRGPCRVSLKPFEKDSYKS